MFVMPLKDSQGSVVLLGLQGADGLKVEQSFESLMQILGHFVDPLLPFSENVSAVEVDPSVAPTPDVMLTYVATHQKTFSSQEDLMKAVVDAVDEGEFWCVYQVDGAANELRASIHSFAFDFEHLTDNPQPSQIRAGRLKILLEAFGIDVPGELRPQAEIFEAVIQSDLGPFVVAVEGATAQTLSAVFNALVSELRRVNMVRYPEPLKVSVRVVPTFAELDPAARLYSLQESFEAVAQQMSHADFIERFRAGVVEAPASVAQNKDGTLRGTFYRFTFEPGSRTHLADLKPVLDASLYGTTLH